ncbi:MAG: NUDIX domain-containing protein [Defluviitaleaceae bacterium]|nr:NUDIX domain-containing protein [Defluviitaleaceae bacterium]
MASCGGVVIYKNKALILYYKNKRGSGWVLPKGKAEFKENHKEAALREVLEETGSKARIIKSLGKTQYNFQRGSITFIKSVYWFLMTADSFYCKPQAEENFSDGGFYKQHEAYHLLKYQDEKELLRRAFNEYIQIKHSKG